MVKKLTYRELEQRVRELEFALASAPDGILLFDEQGRFTYANPAFLEWLGREAEDFVGKTVQGVSPPFMSPETTKTIAERVKKRMETGEPIVGAEVEIFDRGGKPIPVSYSAAGIRDEKGAIVGEVVFLRDITRRKQAQDALWASEKRFRKMADMLPTVISEMDLDCRLTYVNRAGFETFGYSQEDLEGGFKVIDIIHPDDRDSALRDMKMVRKGRKVDGKEYRALRKDGSELAIIVQARPIYQHGRISGIRSTLTDITPIKGTEEALRQREKQLEAKTKGLDEVNTALTVLIKRKDEDREELEEKVVANVRQLVLPLLEKVKKRGLDPEQMAYMDVLESNLRGIISPFARTLSGKYLSLTPTEIHVANLVKEGRASKEIARLMSLSARTIEFHRESIRKKLGIRNRKTNLRTYLLSL